MQAHKTGGEGDELVDLSFRDSLAGVLGHRDVTNNFPGKLKRFLWGKFVLMLLTGRIRNQNGEKAK